MSENLRTTYPIARKKHDCNACDWIEPCLQDIFCELTFKEKRAISRMKNQKGKILPDKNIFVLLEYGKVIFPYLKQI
jgi:hypothetical protein